MIIDLWLLVIIIWLDKFCPIDWWKLPENSSINEYVYLSLSACVRVCWDRSILLQEGIICCLCIARIECECYFSYFIQVVIFKVLLNSSLFPWKLKTENAKDESLSDNKRVVFQFAVYLLIICTRDSDVWLYFALCKYQYTCLMTELSHALSFCSLLSDFSLSHDLIARTFFFIKIHHCFQNIHSKTFLNII